MVYDRRGDLVRVWGGAGLIDDAWGLTVDPRGTVLVADGPSMDSPYGPRVKRFTPDGALLGEPPMVSAVADDGTRWTLAEDVVAGASPDGTALTMIGRNCMFRHVDPLNCPDGPGGTDGGRDIVGGPHGGFALAQPYAALGSRITVFDARGRPRISCSAPRANHLVTSLDYARHGLIVADGLTVRRARFASTPGRHCARLRMRITHVSERRDPHRSGTWLLSYRLSRRARVWLEGYELNRTQCHIPATDPWDRRTGCWFPALSVYHRVAGGRGRHTLRVPTGPDAFQLVSVGPENQGFDTPYIRLH
jgi:hypothetical protein